MKRQKLLWSAAAALAVLGTILLNVRGVRFSGALSWSVALLVILFAVLDRLSKERRWARACLRGLAGLLIAGFGFFLAMEAIVLRDAHTDAEGRDLSCVIILGAGVDGTVPSLSLKSRLDAALAFISDKPDLPVIVSGGRGPGEEITEAECMARYLTAHGVSAERIFLEERAVNTRENFAYSMHLMAENGIDPAESFAFVTSDYHIARGKRFAGVPWAYGVAAHLPRGAYYDALEANYYVREAFALAYVLIFGA